MRNLDLRLLTRASPLLNDARKFKTHPIPYGKTQQIKRVKTDLTFLFDLSNTIIVKRILL